MIVLFLFNIAELNSEDNDGSDSESSKPKKLKKTKSSNSNVPASKNNHKENNEDNFIKQQKRRREEKKENVQAECNDIMKKIINYLLYVSKNIDNFSLESNKHCMLKVFEYLKDYKLDNPINFLKVY
jgi:hypothetical protein